MSFIFVVTVCLWKIVSVLIVPLPESRDERLLAHSWSNWIHRFGDALAHLQTRNLRLTNLSQLHFPLNVFFNKPRMGSIMVRPLSLSDSPRLEFVGPILETRFPRVC
jgi:hypothetical protein